MRPAGVGLVAALVLLSAAPARAQLDRLVGQRIASVELEADGVPVRDPQAAALVQTRPGEPLSMAEVRETLQHLYALDRYEDISADAIAGERGVSIVYRLTPRRVAESLDFTGNLQLSPRRYRNAVADRFGETVGIAQAETVARALEDWLHDEGFFRARVTPRTLPGGSPSSYRLVFDVDAGNRSRIGEVIIEGSTSESEAALRRRLHIEPGALFDPPDLQQRLAEYRDELRAQGHYEAAVSATHTLRENDTVADLLLEIVPGPIVRLVFRGDPLPGNRRADLVPVEREGSADEDLLEDSKRRIERFLQEEGYAEARADYERRAAADGTVEIVFTITRGPLYRVSGVEVVGNTAVSTMEVDPVLSLDVGERFVASQAERDANEVANLYRRRGYSSVAVKPEIVASTEENGVRLVKLRHVVTEGALTTIGTITIMGNAQVPLRVLEGALRLTRGSPFSQAAVEADRSALVLEYLNRGYQSASVDVAVSTGEQARTADLTYTIHEGPLVTVDEIIVVGNRRTSDATIRRELRLAEGEPLGLEQVLESQRRLSALGLFRRVRLTEVPEPGSTRRDVIVSVEEAPATTIGYGAGLEGGRRLRRVEQGAVPSERIEFALRGFFEVGRRNLWGKNRSVNLYSRASLRKRDEVDSSGQSISGFGINEYRVIGSYREPRFIGEATDAQVTAFAEQAIRSSFSYRRRGVNAELSQPLGRNVNALGRYTYDYTDVYEERYSREDKPLIDRLFPQVRLSKVAGILARDSRTDPLDPQNGTFLGSEVEVAAEALGSEVGFFKTFLQGFFYQRLPGRQRVVLAVGGRLGLAKGFHRLVQRVDAEGRPVTNPDGTPVLEEVTDLPASERFFAGGDTTIRGFALDRVGTPETIDADGFPQGGNGVVILNAELRFPVWRDLGGVAFLDTGNVFRRVSDIDFGSLRGGAGFGIRYRSPIGPIRVDLGFKLDRRTLDNGTREPLTAVHISIGQAF